MASRAEPHRMGTPLRPRTVLCPDMSRRQLRCDVGDWINTWNDDPKPFRWTKTADEILDSLAIIYSEDFRRDTRVASCARRTRALLPSLSHATRRSARRFAC